ncbi:MAG TPA: sulfatase-like hydrolase/transferase [Pirellulaceae bacterium]|nr:sulfatase-like hydrolase/transferase [Pirellulaceae bacterium]
MTAAHLWRLSLIAGFIAALSSAQLAAETAPPKPHIVFLLADDLGYADVGFMGSKEIRTPQLDKLAAGGTILDSFYVQPVCSPTRSALMTGRYPTRTGVYTVVRPHARWGLPLEERTLADALRQAGYHTAVCGKWHLGEFETAYQPTHRGFDEQYGHFFGALDYFTKLRDGQRDWYRNDQPSADEGYSTHLLATEACRIIRERPKDKPLFLYVPFNAVHAPYQVPDSYLGPYGQLAGTRQKYAGMIAAMDEAIGQIAAALDETGIRQDTLIVFSSDNGGPGPGTITDNGPLRAGKGTIYEGGVRVCALANWTGRIPAGTHVTEPIHAVDCFPTLVKLAGGSLEQKLPLDGLDVWSTMTQGAKSPHDAILLCGNPNKAAVRSGDWKLIVTTGGANADPPAKAAGKAGGKKKAAKKAQAAAQPVELYNLADDLGEKRNLAAEQPERVAQMRASLDRFLKDAVQPGDQQ